MRRLIDIVAKALSIILYPLFVPTYGMALFCYSYCKGIYWRVSQIARKWS